jgi:putative hydrolase of the HAD superfamily
MVEDSLENLQAAKRLGMRTVWISELSKMPECVDVKLRSVLQLPGVLHRVLNNAKVTL